MTRVRGRDYATSTTRRCDARCHNAQQPECECWCGGLFHGAGGAGARAAFAEAFGRAPCTTEGEFDETTTQSDLFAGGDGQRWRAAIAAARAARSSS